jgi:DNA end-binding protein Ku
MEPVTQIKAAARPSDDDDRHEEPPAEPGGHLERHEMVRGYEFEKGRFVLFTPDELKALQEASRDSIDIVAFIPEAAVDPIYYDKAYLVAPDKRGERTYALLLEALRTSARTALARWAWKGKEYVVQVRAADDGLVLQQLLYADEVRLPSVLDLQLPAVGQAELQLALKLIEQGSQEVYDPAQFVDEEKQRILAAVERKIAGGSVVSHRVREPARPSGQVIDLLDALRASLHPPPAQVASKSRPRQRAKVSSRN